MSVRERGSERGIGRSEAGSEGSEGERERERGEGRGEREAGEARSETATNKKCAQPN